jgi:hypothetical protein
MKKKTISTENENKNENENMCARARECEWNGEIVLMREYNQFFNHNHIHSSFEYFFFQVLFLAERILRKRLDPFWKFRLITPNSEENTFAVPQYNRAIREMLLERDIIIECGFELHDALSGYIPFLSLQLMCYVWEKVI